jgi:ATP-binding cassette subfamily B protein
MFMMAMQVGGVSIGDVTLEQMLAAVPDVDALVAELGTVTGPAVGGAPVPQWSTITFEQVSYTYPGADRAALSELDLSLRAGSSLAIVGVNGAGKTTLITLLARLRDPTTGRIAVDGIDLSALDPLAWQRRVAVVYQDFTHYPLTARENVALVDLEGEVDDELLARAVEMAGATSVIDGLPHGWDTVLAAGYRRGGDLSGGQWQRIALARALYAVGRGAGLLVLDEPTAQLDIRSEAAFYERFLELTTGVTSIVISHRFSTVRRAERIAVLDGGRITELGTHDELLALGGTYAEMFRAQAAGFLERQRADG